MQFISGFYNTLAINIYIQCTQKSAYQQRHTLPDFAILLSKTSVTKSSVLPNSSNPTILENKKQEKYNCIFN